MTNSKVKIYHIVHVDKLSSIIQDGFLWSDAIISKKMLTGTTIGMEHIKQRRLTELTLSSHPSLHVGECVPFYFCPRSVMLYVINMRNNDDIVYEGGQDKIVHLEIDFYRAIDWANANNKKWAFTSSNAGSSYFEDTKNVKDIEKLDWNTINNHFWMNNKESKQAEFLCEEKLPWDLVELIGVNTDSTYSQVLSLLKINKTPKLEIKNDWYY